MQPTKKPRNYKYKQPILPLFCDFDCRHASFAPNDAAGACRREQAVYCIKTKHYNNKHARCILRK